MSTQTQCSQILRHLRTGKRLTALEALDRFDCLRLAARIGELKKAGHAIDRKMVQLANGKKVASYWMH